MLLYPLEEAVELLSQKLDSAKKSNEETVEDLEWLKEQVTVMEVNFARVHNVSDLPVNGARGFDADLGQWDVKRYALTSRLHTHAWLTRIGGATKKLLARASLSLRGKTRTRRRRTGTRVSPSTRSLAAGCAPALSLLHLHLHLDMDRPHHPAGSPKPSKPRLKKFQEGPL